MVLGWIGAVLGWFAAAGTVVGGTTMAWLGSPLRRSYRAAVRAVRPVRRAARVVEKALRSRRRQWEDAARDYAGAQRKSQRARVAVESLREAGAEGVRWSALEEAGVRSLGDLEGKSATDLDAIPGIGRASGEKLVAAARRVGERLDQEGTDPPAPDLDAPAAEALARRTLDYLDARAAGGAEPRAVQQAGEELCGRLAELRRDTGLRAWLGDALRRKGRERREEVIARARQVQEDAGRIAADGRLRKAREGARGIRRHRAAPRDREAVASTWKERYAECWAALEHLFARLGLRSGRRVAAGQGGLSEEVARRVEAFTLRTANLRMDLRRYQEFGAKYLLVQERTILGDEMGLGKTAQALAAMTHLADEREEARFLVVAPAGLLWNWLREIQRFTPLRGHLLHGRQLGAGLRAWAAEGGVAVTSYETLRKLDLEALPAGAAVDLCVVDEAHFIKNPEAERTRAVREALDRSHRACLMSGTPMENHPREFLNLIEAVRPRDAAEIDSGALMLDAAAGSVRSFHRNVARMYLRRNQEDVLRELPERIVVEEWVELSAAERERYRVQVKSRNFMGMRQAATAREGQPSSKLDHLEELLEDHRESQRKVLVFSYFLGVLRAVAERVPAVGLLSGSLSPARRQELCDAFQSRPGHQVLLLQIQAGGQGLNLQAASVVVLMEPQVKPSSEDQAVARAHRMGQTQRVLVHRLLARNTCDAALLEILAEKQELFEAYARQSLVKEASGAAVETAVARAVLEVEAARLASEHEEPALAPEGTEAQDELGS